mmetsp:Transcript_8573/g.16906  ORF Transcript_8573/g.16906 Transcript_8573/m.16906 type:complete len:219 (+) Transcript_8573:1904-2560(+)
MNCESRAAGKSVVMVAMFAGGHEAAHVPVVSMDLHWTNDIPSAVHCDTGGGGVSGSHVLQSDASPTMGEASFTTRHSCHSVNSGSQQQALSSYSAQVSLRAVSQKKSALSMDVVDMVMMNRSYTLPGNTVKNSGPMSGHDDEVHVPSESCTRHWRNFSPKTSQSAMIDDGLWFGLIWFGFIDILCWFCSILCRLVFAFLGAWKTWWKVSVPKESTNDK